MIWVITIFVGFLIDFITKQMALKYLVDGVSIEIIPSFLYFTKHINTGAAWGFLSSYSWGIVVLSIISIVSFFAILYLIYKAEFKSLKFGLSVLNAGCLGNLIDRVFRKGVVDMIDVKIFGYDFPIFNIADSLVCCSVAFLLIMYLYLEKKQAKEVV